MVSRFLKFERATELTADEAKLWSYAAWTLPFVALAVVVFEHYIGWTDLKSKTIITITVIFFSVSVYWWWWALNKFVSLLAVFQSNEQKFAEVSGELRRTQEELRVLREENVGDRER